MRRFRAGARGTGTVWAAGLAALCSICASSACIGPGLEPPWEGERGAADDSAGFGNVGEPAAGMAPGAATGGTGAMAGTGGVGGQPTSVPPTPSDPGSGTSGMAGGMSPSDGGQTPPPATGTSNPPDFSSCEQARIPLAGPTANLIAPPDPPPADAGAPSACEYVLPLEATAYLPDLLNVVITSLEGQQATLRRVPDATACDGSVGYYYDDPVSPTRVIVCPSHCGFPVELVLGCPSLVR